LASSKKIEIKRDRGISACSLKKSNRPLPLQRPGALDQDEQLATGPEPRRRRLSGTRRVVMPRGPVGGGGGGHGPAGTPASGGAGVVAAGGGRRGRGVRGPGPVGPRTLRGARPAFDDTSTDGRGSLGVEVGGVHRRPVGSRAGPPCPLVRPGHQPPDRPWR